MFARRYRDATCYCYVQYVACQVASSVQQAIEAVPVSALDGVQISNKPLRCSI